MNTTQLTCFLTVAETLNFARAAEKLNIAQPSLTHQIQSLEKELDVKLFNRTTRTVEITQAGAAFVSDAKIILNISNRAKTRFSKSSSEQWQYFTVGCHSYNDLYMLSDVLRQLSKQYSNIYPSFQVVPFEYLYQLMDGEGVDMVVAFQKEDMKRNYLQYKELTKIPVAAVMAADRPFMQTKRIDATNLKNERLILIEPQKCPGCLEKIHYHLIGDRQMTDLYFCDSMNAALALARADYGIAVLPDLFALHDPALRYIPLDGFEAMSYGAYYKDVKEKPIIKSFLQLAEKYFTAE